MNDPAIYYGKMFNDVLDTHGPTPSTRLVQSTRKGTNRIWRLRMKLQKYSLLFLVSALFFSLTSSVEASPNPQQDPQDALIRQCLLQPRDCGWVAK